MTPITAYRFASAFLAASLALIAFAAGPLKAAEFYILTTGASSQLHTVDSTSGASLLVGPTGGGFMSDIALSPGGVLYATDGSNLYTLNRTNGAVSFVTSISGVTFITGLDFSSGGTLYGTDEGDDNVYSIDTGSGLATSELATGASFRGDVAHSQGDIFYAASQFLAEIHLTEIDLGGGSSSDQGFIAAGEFIGGLDFDDVGNLFAFSGDGDIYRIPSPATSGAALFVASSSLTGVNGATHNIPIPEPSGFVLALAAIDMLFLTRRRMVSRAGG